jgi:hypothetical protein
MVAPPTREWALLTWNLGWVRMGIGANPAESEMQAGKAGRIRGPHAVASTCKPRSAAPAIAVPGSHLHTALAVRAEECALCPAQCCFLGPKNQTGLRADPTI